MKNLKRILSLALASVMVMGMMVVGASAAFNDQADIDHAEAVNTLVALGIIKGKEGNNFDPDGLLTRAEMATVIAVIRNKGIAPNFGTKPTPTYSDIDNHWAESYIEYCNSFGIVGGVGGGKFDPEGKLTATQAARMLLNAMGYGIEDPSNWALLTEVQAREENINLYKGIDTEIADPTNANITRQQMAQMAYNALTANMNDAGTYTEDSAETVGTGKYKIVKGTNALDPQLVAAANTRFNSFADAKEFAETILGSNPHVYGNDYKIEEVVEYKKVTRQESLAHKYLQMSRHNGILERVALQTSGINAGLYQVVTDAATFYTETDVCSELIGEKVQILYKGSDNYAVYGVTAKGSVVYEGTVGELNEEKVGMSREAQAALAAAANAYTWNTSSKDITWATADPSFAVKVSQTGSDSNGNPVYNVAVKPHKLGTVTFLSDKNVTVSGTGVSTAKLDKVNAYAGMKKGDAVIVIEAAQNADSKAQIIKPETVSGMITSVKDTNTVRINGEWYPMAGNVAPGNKLTASNMSNNKTLTIYNGYYVAQGVMASATEASKDLVWVLGTKTASTGGYNDSTEQARIVGLDGKVQTIVYDKVESDNKIAGKLCNYSVDKDIYTLTVADEASTGYDKAVAADQKYERADSKLTNDTRIADDAVVVIVYKNGGTGASTTSLGTGKGLDDIAKADTLTGAQLKKWDDADYGDEDKTVGFIETVNGIDYVKLLCLAWGADQTGSATGTGANYGYITADSTIEYNASDKSYANVFKMWDGTEEIEVREVKKTNNFASTTVSKGDVITYADVDAGIITGVAKLNVGTAVNEIQTGAIVGVNEKDEVISIRNTDGTANAVVTVDKDTVILYVDTTKHVGTQSSGLPLADQNADGSYPMNIKFTARTGANTKAGLIIVDTTGAVKGTTPVHVGATELGVAGTALTKADIKAQADGMYTPVAGTGTGKTEFTGNYGNFDKLLFFKFQAAKDNTYTLTIKTGATDVYVETSSAMAANGPVVFYVDTMAPQGGNWKTTDLQNTGTFTYTITYVNTSGTTVTVLAGSFTK